MAINLKRRPPPLPVSPVGRGSCGDGREKVRARSLLYVHMYVCLCAGVCVLPEVGDLLLSMSTDCWLSDSSVRPDGGDQKGEGQQQALSQISSSSFCFSRKHNTEVSSIVVSHPRLQGRGYSMNDCLVTTFFKA